MGSSVLLLKLLLQLALLSLLPLLLGELPQPLQLPCLPAFRWVLPPELLSLLR